MRICLLKSALSLLSDYHGDKSFDITIHDKDDKEATIKISEGEIVIVVGSNEHGMYIPVEDIADISLGDDWRITYFLEKTCDRSGVEIENHRSQITNENFFIVRLMKIFGDKFNLLIKANGVFYNAYHVDGKVNFVENREDYLQLMSDTIYRLSKSYNDFEVTAMGPSISKLSHQEYVDIQLAKSTHLDKPFRR